MSFNYGTQFGEFDVLLLDPPWHYANRLTGTGRTKFGGGADGHYNTMKNPDIVALGPLLEKICAPRAAIFMWVTPPNDRWKYELGDAANWAYSTKAFDWVKFNKKGVGVKLNPGTYTSSNSEDCCLFTYRRQKWMGKLKPSDVGGQRMVSSVIENYTPLDWMEQYDEDMILNPRNGATLAWPSGTLRIKRPLMEHSQKPDDVHERIDLMYPGARKVEIFARRPYPGWSAIGNAIDGLDIRDALKLAAAGYYDLEKEEMLYG